MTGKDDDLLISVSTDLTTIKRQLRQLGQDITASTSGYTKSFDAFGKSIDQSMSPVQKRINDLVGIPVASKVKEWQGALAHSSVEMGKFGATSKLTANQMLNLSRQGNDVITMFALGAPPMQIFASQAGQIYDALENGPRGLRGSLKAVGDGVLGLVTRFPLATAAAAAAAVAIAAYAIAGGSDIKSLDDIVKSHDGNIKLLGDAWDEASAKKRNYAALSVNSVNALNEKDVQDARDLLATQIKGIFDEVYRTVGGGGGGQGPLQRVIQSQFEPFEQALSDLAKNSDVKAFISQIDAIAEINPKLSSARDSLRDLALQAAITAATLPGLAQKADEVGNEIDKFDRAMANVSSKPLQDALQDIFDKAKDGKLSIDEINAAIADLERANPSFAGIISALHGIISEARGASQAVADAYAASAGGSPNGRHVNRIQIATERSIQSALYRGTDITPTPAPNREDLGAEYDKAVARANKKSRTNAPAKTADDRFFEDIEAIRQRTAALAQETAMVGASFEAQTKRKTAFDLEQQALKQVREEARKKGDQDWQNAKLTDEQIAKINEVSDAYARQAEALRKAEEAQQDLQEWMNVGRDATRGFIDDLISGASAGDAFANVLKKIGDQLLELAMNDLFGRGNGNGFGLIGQVFGIGGGGGGGFASGGSDPWAGLRFDKGGYTGPGGKYQPAGIVHKGEYVFDAETTKRIGVDNLRKMQGYANGGLVGAPSMPRIHSPANQNNGPSMTFAPVIDARGADAAAVDRLQKVVAKQQMEFESRVKMIVKGRPNGRW
ncbi:hypothetical protein G6N74_28435 [Mesorhizobium sp. CGMCC 1.15528]|uniref:Bacteriophage tail tape measure N-terminal domain-containing protein n=1 Tax=Mesorhizobium zhangyense TaxID=1776730 RepID=A0A7C9VGM3_9HYPH|nr:phage tail length tape measure family protein [Mesorhizobium zhangyense]NGN44989.1 hypothetical protein [Mesorhizobium zhangyense]